MMHRIYIYSIDIYMCKHLSHTKCTHVVYSTYAYMRACEKHVEKIVHRQFDEPKNQGDDTAVTWG